MADTFDAGKFGGIVTVPFQKANCTTQLTDSDLTLLQSTLAVAPAAGSVIGISIRSSGALTAGTITAKAHKAGTEYTDTSAPAPVISSTAQVSYATCRSGLLTFAAGDTLGVSVSTTTTLDPTNTADVDAILFIQLNPT